MTRIQDFVSSFTCFLPIIWGNAYGKESINAFANGFLRNKLMSNPKFLIKGQPFEEIEVSAFPSNMASTKVIEEYLKPVDKKIENLHGDKRNVYRIKK